MSRATTKGGSTFSLMTFVAFLIGVGIGIGFVAPVLPRSIGMSVLELVRAGGTVILVSALALAAVMVLLAVLYQGYLKA